MTSSNLRKYQSRNPLVQYLIQRFLRKLIGEISAVKPQTIIDLGCGEGLVAEAVLKELGGVTYRGYDKSRIAVDEAQRRNLPAEFQNVDIFDLQDVAEGPDLVLCLEVIEHIEDTDRLLKRIACQQGRCVILSVPWEPFFRLGNLCRGQYLRQLGNHPEHVHCFGKASLKSALKRHFSQVRIETSFPWLLGICRNKIGIQKIEI